MCKLALFHFSVVKSSLTTEMIMRTLMYCINTLEDNIMAKFSNGVFIEENIEVGFLVLYNILIY